MAFSMASTMGRRQRALFAAMVATMCGSAAAYRVQPGPFTPRAALRVHRPPLACASADGGATKESLAEIAAAKRKRADELAAKAARMDLEAEVLELQAKELALSVALKRSEEEAAAGVVASNGEDAAAVAPPPVVIESVPMSPTSTESGSAGSEPAAAPASPFNVSALLSADSLPPPPPMSYGAIASVVQRSGLDEAALQLSEAQVATCRERVFDLESYYVTQVDQTFLGTIFRGNLRGNSSGASFARVAANAEREASLRGVTFVLLDDPVALTLQDVEAGRERRPVYLALPDEAVKVRQGVPEYLAFLIGSFSSAITTLGFALSTYLLADGGAMLSQLEAGDTAPLDTAAPIALGLLLLQLLHEGAHLALASKHQLKVGLPTAVPSLQLGTFGCVTRLLELPKSRQAVFEFALAGPFLALALSLAAYAVGIGLSMGLPVPEIPTIDLSSAGGAGADPKVIADAAAAAAAKAAAAAGEILPVIPSALIQSSLLLGAIATAAIPTIASSPAVSLHPLAVVGFVGAFVNALALLPVGRLDGGRVATALFGQSTGGLVSSICLLVIGISTFFGPDDPLLLFFGLFIIFFQRRQELPARDDITGVDDNGQLLAALAAVFTLLVLLPFPGTPVPVEGAAGFF